MLKKLLGKAMNLVLLPTKLLDGWNRIVGYLLLNFMGGDVLVKTAFDNMVANPSGQNIMIFVGHLMLALGSVRGAQKVLVK